MIRIVFDTNVLISAFLSRRGKPYTALEWAARNAIVLSCRAAMGELGRKLAHRKFEKYITADDRMHLLALYEAAVEMVDLPDPHGVSACRDPDDDLFLALAIAGHADVLVSGDNDLKSLGSFRGVLILSPEGFLAVTGVTP